MGDEREIEKRRGNRIICAIGKGLLYVIQICAFCSFAYVIASACSTFLLSDIVQAFGAYAVHITGAAEFGDLMLGDLFGFFMLPSAFMMLVLFAAYIALCVFVWRFLARWLGGLRSAIVDKLCD